MFQFLLLCLRSTLAISSFSIIFDLPEPFGSFGLELKITLNLKPL